MQVINPPELGTPLFSYSHGIDAANMVFVAGMTALDEHGTVLAQGDIAEQTRIAIKNLEIVLTAAGTTLDNVVYTTAYIKDWSYYEDYNRTYAQCFGNARPARATVQAGMVFPELLIEIQAIAVKSP